MKPINFSELNFYCNPVLNQNLSNILLSKFVRPLTSLPTQQLYYDLKNKIIYKNIPEHLRDATFIYPILIPKTFQNLEQYEYYDDSYENVPWSMAFEGRRRCMQWLRTPSEMVSQYFSWVGVEASEYVKLLSYPLSYVLPLFKKIKIYCHNNYENFGACCRYFVDLDAISGIPITKIRSSGDDPYKWLTQTVMSLYDRNWWKKQFLETFSQFATHSPSNFLTLQEFALNRWLWVTHGSTKFSKLMLEDKVVKTKFGAAVSLTDDEILKHIDDALAGKPEEQIKVFVKPDEASFKRRLIANVPLGGYIIAAYVRWLLEQYLGKEPGFEKLNTTILDTVNIVRLLKEGRVALPLDESAYDYHVTRDSWLGFFDFLDYAFPGNVGCNCLKRYFNTANWHFEDTQDKWMKGMPSGLALTTFLNSWMNYIKQKTIVNSDIHWACGDDVLTFPYDKDISLLDIEREYAKFGSEANATKNWRSTRFCEYLKVLYGRYGTSGYPARIYGSLLFSKEPSPTNPNEKLYELTDLWKQFFDRMGLPMDEDLVARDLASAMSKKIPGFNKYTAKLWLHSPKIHGGYGKLPYNDFTFTWELEDKIVTSYTLSRYRLPPVVKYSGKTRLLIGKYKTKESSFKFGPPATLPPIQTEEDWIRRLNREDIPDRGPFTGMVLDLVPLPVIDFVSVASMSKYAAANYFYCYPNLRGSWNQIANRLISGSKLLARSILNFCSFYHIDFLI